MSDETSEIELKLPTLAKGASPSGGPMVVMRLQGILNDLALGPLVEDGDFGPKTDAAVKTFQANDGLATDGVVGPKTWTSLLTIWLLSSEGC